MSNQNDPLLAKRMAELLPSLAATAANLNNASKKLTEIIERLDGALQRLNLGVTAWVQVNGANSSPDLSAFWSEDLGYSRIGRKWGLALRRIEGDHALNEWELLDEWPFNEAPRDLRIGAITRIPKLLKKLDQEAQMVAEEISESIDVTVPIVTAIEDSAHPQRSIKKEHGGRS